VFRLDLTLFDHPFGLGNGASGLGRNSGPWGLASRARWFDPVADAIARGFPDAGPIRQVVRDCIDRDPGFVGEYLAEKFELADEEPIPEPEPAGPISSGGLITRVWTNAPDVRADEPQPVPEPGNEVPTAGKSALPVEPPVQPEAETEVAPATDQPAGTAEQMAENAGDDPGPVRTLPEWKGSPPAGDGRRGGPPSGSSPAKPDASTKPASAPKPAGPTLFERFAAALGFSGSEDEREFRHPDGSILVKAAKPFGWEFRGGTGWWSAATRWSRTVC
jgi:hypothetical protein